MRTSDGAASAITRALLEGIYVYKTNKDFSKKVIGKYVKTNDTDALEDQVSA